ncbi:probable G-protein coupled receptor Mth-like 10 [Panulirus ornatus]|uniref:probable G-protein coupled receptor Mth-like 10 n=1 Tax=Panulirus ornatus TaxID=150431 RepID=UPI003A88A990
MTLKTKYGEIRTQTYCAVGFSRTVAQWLRVPGFLHGISTLGLLTQFGFLAAFFWLHILCFDTWRTIRSLTKLRTPTNKSNWAYPLYAFGGPLVIGAITACVHFFAPNNVAGVIKPLIGDSSCWFRGDLQLLVYFYGPVAFLFASNFVLLSNTYWKCRTFQLNSAILRDYRSEDTSDETALNINHPRQNHISNFKQQFFLLVLTLVCWSCELLSWKIRHPEVWMFTDVLNALQGFFIFVIFMANGNKRRQLAEKYPNLFSKVKHIFSLKRVKSRILCRGNDAGTDHLDVISRFRGNLPSFHATIPTPRARCSLASESESNIITLSHAHLTLSNRPLYSPGFGDVSSSQLQTTNVDCSPESANVSSAHSGGITSVKCSP